MTATEGFMKAQIQQLEEENKKLKDKIEHLEFDIEAWKKLKAVWEKKEQKLQIEIGGLMGERDGLKMAVDKLKEENQTLELWLDNKEKLNEEYRKQIDKLKSDLGECECSFGFENDEVGYRKRECKKLKAELDKYKKQYEHSMGEDEWKKRKTVFVRNSKGDYVESQIGDRRFIEDDTLQELKEIGELEDDELIYEEGLYD